MNLDILLFFHRWPWKAAQHVGQWILGLLMDSLSLSMLCQVLPHGPPGVSASLLPVRSVPGLPGQAPRHQPGH